MKKISTHGLRMPTSTPQSQQGSVTGRYAGITRSRRLTSGTHTNQQPSMSTMTSPSYGTCLSTMTEIKASKPDRHRYQGQQRKEVHDQ